ncbi:MAG: tetratricopeptide repeat protein [Candidatus Vogelbacteria bacterium]
MNFQELVEKAQKLHKIGERTEALKYYNEAFEKLADEAAIHAHSQPGTFRDNITTKEEKVRTVFPKLFDETKNFLKRDRTAYVLLKNMAVVYHELGDDKVAINALEQAIELTPDGEDNSDAKVGLEKLKK